MAVRTFAGPTRDGGGTSTKISLREYRDNVLSSTDIIDLISGYIKITKTSADKAKAVCPFHSDTDPSLSIMGAAGWFQCFGCGIKGNAIDFLIAFEKIDFKEALDKLADIAGIEPVSYRPKGRPETVEVLTGIANEYHARLLASQSARKYLSDRSVGKKAIERLKLGYTGLAAPPFDTKAMERLGIMNGSYLWKDAVAFPFFSSSECVYMTSRVINPGSGSKKHIHITGSKEHLYNENALRHGDGLLLVESPMCACSIVEHTDLSPVAILGTGGFSEPDIFKMRFTPGDKTVVLALDADKSGEDAAVKIGKLLMDNCHRVAVMSLPEGINDPNEFFMAGGTGEEFMERYNAAEDFVGWTLARLTVDREKILAKPFGRAELIKRSEPVVSLIKHVSPMQQEVYVQYIAEALGISERSVRGKLAEDMLK